MKKQRHVLLEVTASILSIQNKLIKLANRQGCSATEMLSKITLYLINKPLKPLQKTHYQLEIHPEKIALFWPSHQSDINLRVKQCQNQERSTQEVIELCTTALVLLKLSCHLLEVIYINYQTWGCQSAIATPWSRLNGYLKQTLGGNEQARKQGVHTILARLTVFFNMEFSLVEKHCRLFQYSLGKNSFIHTKIPTQAYHYHISLGPLNRKSYQQFVSNTAVISLIKKALFMHLHRIGKLTLSIKVAKQQITSYHIGQPQLLARSTWLNGQPTAYTHHIENMTAYDHSPYPKTA